MKPRDRKQNNGTDLSALGLSVLLNFMIQVSAKSETVVTEALESELQNWVQVDLINRGQWLAVTTERSTAEEVNEADSAAEKPGDETNERTNESQPGTSP